MTGRSDNSWIRYNQTMPLMFYILYTPDTVHFLLGLAQTLLVDPQIKLCLVDNGCRRAEIALLERFCLAHPACQTMVLSQTEILPHGLALEKLLQAAPGNELLLNRLGTFYLMANKPRKAIDAATKILEKDPSNYSALRVGGDAYLNIAKH